jgi:hypothetical protein
MMRASTAITAARKTRPRKTFSPRACRDAAVSFAPICGISAGCFGTPGFQTCNDSYGKSYSVNRMGSMTQMYGNNPYTGSNWPQMSLPLGGGMTMHNGMTNGSPWFMNKQSLGVCHRRPSS